MDGWSIEVTEEADRELRRYAKDHPAEHGSVMVNLERIVGELESGHRMGSFSFGFLRSEGGGVHRIGQTGVPNAHETRLYVCPDETSRVMYVVGIGDKQGQSRDIAAARTAASILRGRVDRGKGL